MDAQLTAGEVLRAFHRDEPYLFLGAASTTVGIVAAAFPLLRRRFDALLLSMAAFAILYGQRLWLDAGLLRMTSPRSVPLDQWRAAVDFLVPIPAFLFFYAAGFLGRMGKAIAVASSILFLALVTAVFAFGHLGLLYAINNTLVVAALLVTIAASLRWGAAGRDSWVVRGGLLCFAALALWDNIARPRVDIPKIEPYGFAVFLACLGYVAARRLIDRDVELGEIRKELELAHSIQQSILPAAFPPSKGFRVAARCVPMTSVAGDFYDFLVADDRHAGLLIADVSGHGVPAALIASMVKMAAAAQRDHAARPARLMSGMNTALCGNTQGQYVTAAYLYLDAEGRKLRYSAAGHPSMMLMRRGAVLDITENGLLLAAWDAATYSERTLPLEPGDRMLLYTDGLIEARNAHGEFFGEESLADALRGSAALSAAETADALISQVLKWSRAQEDDLTVLVCDVLSPA